jgi:hypothetical protein
MTWWWREKEVVVVVESCKRSYESIDKHAVLLVGNNTEIYDSYDYELL